VPGSAEAGLVAAVCTKAALRRARKAPESQAAAAESWWLTHQDRAVALFFTDRAQNRGGGVVVHARQGMRRGTSSGASTIRAGRGRPVARAGAPLRVNPTVRAYQSPDSRPKPVADVAFPQARFPAPPNSTRSRCVWIRRIRRLFAGGGEQIASWGTRATRRRRSWSARSR